MATTTSRTASTSSSGTGTYIIISAIAGLALLVAGGAYVALKLGRRLAGLPSAGGFTATLQGLIRGRIGWPTQATLVLVGMLAIVAAIAVAVVLLRRVARSGRTRVDTAAQQMGRGDDIETMTRHHAEQKGTAIGAAGTVGLNLGNTVVGNVPTASSPEDVGVLFAGPRTMKTTCYAIPALCDAPGSALATTNKRDLVDATRGIREKLGTVWVFDPQQLVGEQPSWWWNPLSFIMINDGSGLAPDRERAIALAGIFAAFDSGPSAKRDPQFDGMGENLLAAFLLAAAIGDRPITDVYRWTTNPNNTDPLEILEQAGEDLDAEMVDRLANNTPDRERSGYYSTAMRMCQVLANKKLWPWTTRSDAARPEFSPEEFVRSTDTLYLLSQEKTGSNAGPMVTALTVAILEAAQEYGSRAPGGRLPVHLTAVLDEAANVCRWGDLPNQYSHLGSRGIVVLTILQSYAQGRKVWGEEGMAALWSASNFGLYGGNIRQTDFLEELSKLIGEWDRPTRSESWSEGRRTVSRDTRRERILDVADLAALPRRRAVLFGSGARATMLRTQPWSERADADQISESIRRYDPQANKTLADMQRDLAAEKADESGELDG